MIGQMQQQGAWVGIHLSHEPNFTERQNFVARRALMEMGRGAATVKNIRLQAITRDGRVVGFGHIIQANGGRLHLDTASKKHTSLLAQVRELLDLSNIRFTQLGTFVENIDMPTLRTRTES